MNAVTALISARLHTAMYAMFSKVPSENIAQMGLLRFADLPFFLACGPVIAYQTHSNIKRFRKNLVEREWPSISAIYPRTFLWFYAYNLFLWGRYCNALEKIFAHPERCLLAEIYIRYICQIDTYLDSFDSRSLIGQTTRVIKSQPEIKSIEAEIINRTHALFSDEKDRMYIESLIDTYLDNSLIAINQWMECPSLSLQEVIAHKETTAGTLHLVWSLILGCLYRVPEELSTEAAGLFFNYSMAFQIIDDISDARQDYLVKSPNVFLSIAEEYPTERDCLQAHFEGLQDKFMHWPWMKSNTPCAFDRAVELVLSYARANYRQCRRIDLVKEVNTLMSRMINVSGYSNKQVKKGLVEPG